MVDDFNGNRVNVEDCSDEKLAEMDADYATYMPQPSTWFGDVSYRDNLQAGWDEIREEIKARKEEHR